MERWQEPHLCKDFGLTCCQLDCMLETQVVQTIRRFWRCKGGEEKHMKTSTLGFPQIMETLYNLGIGGFFMEGGSGKRQVPREI